MLSELDISALNWIYMFSELDKSALNWTISKLWEEEMPTDLDTEVVFKLK